MSEVVTPRKTAGELKDLARQTTYLLEIDPSGTNYPTVAALCDKIVARARSLKDLCQSQDPGPAAA